MSEEVIELVEQKDGAVTGLRRVLVVRDGLHSPPQVPGVSVVLWK